MSSHRLSNSLLKLLYRHTHSRLNRHNERLWPHVRVGRNAAGEIDSFSYRGRDFPLMNHVLTRGCRGGTGHIIASGPSVNDIDYAQLALTDVMGVNGAIALTDTHPITFDTYCFNDTGFVRARPQLVKRIVTQDLLLFTTPLSLWHVLQQLPPDDIRCRIFLIENPQYRARLPLRSVQAVMADAPAGALTLFDEARVLGYAHDIRQGLFDAGTVAYSALQIMAWLGHTEIVLHGVDLQDAAKVPRFYETPADTLPTTLDQYLPHHILPAFTAAANLLADKGVRLVNLSPNSALVADRIEKRDWRMLAGNKPVGTT
ncbi:hypothetical protein [Pigmentiphaga litoralis]|uniref:Lipopolysaccharide core biosynthesis protein n=1 Tax=Pigmentiphaga litoralis TaxID=516702 RepID=A0A7Y9LL55_9BURK|nr:hypothetical protein [Pigmentiphaga litoralis]NYE24184.1 hypothetical protein [Pigmentiphaga litoralis]NYE82202.1 hypothetical protein [Pigmentiphaga litoralis]